MMLKIKRLTPTILRKAIVLVLLVPGFNSYSSDQKMQFCDRVWF